MSKNEKKKLLIFSWEFEGFNSKQGAALSRRIKQVAESFSDNNWEVVVIHKDCINECVNCSYKISKFSENITRIAVKYTENSNAIQENVLFRKLITYYYVTFLGDRTYEWTKQVIKLFNEFEIETPDLIMSFFTPRAPLILGNFYSKKFNLPWIADLQDEVSEGISKVLINNNIIWTKNILKTAKAIVQVSPEWATKDGNILGIKINTIRHAIPNETENKTHENVKDESTFNIFYGGSIFKKEQSLYVLKNVLDKFINSNKNIVLNIAGGEYVYDIFSTAIKENIKINYLGWLNREQYYNAIYNSDCLLVIPWSFGLRQVIPSKFYELCSLKIPIWIIGNCTGSFNYLLDEWKHPKIYFDNIEYQTNALQLALNNDYSKMFNIENCKNKQLFANDLYKEYISLI